MAKYLDESGLSTFWNKVKADGVVTTEGPISDTTKNGRHVLSLKYDSNSFSLDSDKNLKLNNASAETVTVGGVQLAAKLSGTNFTNLLVRKSSSAANIPEVSIPNLTMDSEEKTAGLITKEVIKKYVSSELLTTNLTYKYATELPAASKDLMGIIYLVPKLGDNIVALNPNSFTKGTNVTLDGKNYTFYYFNYGYTLLPSKGLVATSTINPTNGQYVKLVVTEDISNPLNGEIGSYTNGSALANAVLRSGTPGVFYIGYLSNEGRVPETITVSGARENNIYEEYLCNEVSEAGETHYYWELIGNSNTDVEIERIPESSIEDLFN